ncbi:MAG: 23S rRNA (adenine(2503)-C2)-methyltransferase, partial [Spirochaetales bacterium]|nr:23S rRNA (adenine(2503)-C2)-methyltransferase [Spirochaetales bacterium]
MESLLTGMLPDELAHHLALRPSFRGKQVFEWIHRGVTSFAEMTNLPLEVRESLKERQILTSEVSKEALSDDGTA